MSGKGSGARDPARRKCTDAEYGDRWEATFGKERPKSTIPWGNTGDPDEAVVTFPNFIEEMSKAFPLG